MAPGTRALLRAWLLLAAVGVAGCGEGKVVPPPTPEPTASPTPEPEVIVAAAGDITCGPTTPAWARCRHLETAALLAAAPPLAAVLPLGDLQYESGTLAEFQAFYENGWGRFKAISHPAVGNHEYQTRGAAGYFDDWNGRGVNTGTAGSRGGGYYSFRMHGWLFIALNSNCDEAGGCHAGSPQDRFLRTTLAGATEPCTLAYWHHPRWSSGPSGNMIAYDPFWQALYEGGADVVLVGHDHMYERFAPMAPDGRRDDARGIPQFTVGTGGHSLYAFGTPHPNSLVRFNDEYGVLFVKLQPASYSWRFEPIDRRPGVVDTGSAACH